MLGQALMGVQGGSFRFLCSDSITSLDAVLEPGEHPLELQELPECSPIRADGAQHVPRGGGCGQGLLEPEWHLGD